MGVERWKGGEWREFFGCLPVISHPDSAPEIASFKFHSVSHSVSNSFESRSIFCLWFYSIRKNACLLLLTKGHQNHREMDSKGINYVSFGPIILSIWVCFFLENTLIIFVSGFLFSSVFWFPALWVLHWFCV